jgi:hypothetical protein
MAQFGAMNTDLLVEARDDVTMVPGLVGGEPSEVAKEPRGEKLLEEAASDSALPRLPGIQWSKKSVWEMVSITYIYDNIEAY